MSVEQSDYTRPIQRRDRTPGGNVRHIRPRNPADNNPYRDLAIKDAGFSRPATYALSRLDVETVRELIEKYPEAQLKRKTGFGAGVVNDIKTRLAGMDLELDVDYSQVVRAICKAAIAFSKAGRDANIPGFNVVAPIPDLADPLVRGLAVARRYSEVLKSPGKYPDEYSNVVSLVIDALRGNTPSLG